MKVKIDNNEIELIYSMRAYIIYESIMGKSVDFKDFTNYTNLIVLFFSVILSTLKKNKIDRTFGYDDFMDWVDENGGSALLNEFAEWFAETLTRHAEIGSEEVEEGDNSKNS